MKQLEDDKTLELSLPRRRGRPRKYANNAERQMAYRDRLDPGGQARRREKRALWEKWREFCNAQDLERYEK